jgi:hypothetical protein
MKHDRIRLKASNIHYQIGDFFWNDQFNMDDWTLVSSLLYSNRTVHPVSEFVQNRLLEDLVNASRSET